MANLNSPRIDDGTPLRAVELTADEADAYIKAKRWPAPYGDDQQIDYAAHTAECADSYDYDDKPGQGSGVILWPLAVLLVAAICGGIVSLVRS